MNIIENFPYNNNNYVNRFKNRLQNYVQKVKKENKNNDFEWLKQQLDKKRIYIAINNEKKFLKRIKLMANVLNKVYKKNWDFYLIPYIDSIKRDKKNVMFRFYILIKYDIIKIKNNKNISHIIKDLYILLQLDNGDNNFAIKRIRGLRSTLSYIEQRYGYIHSHASITYQDSFNYALQCPIFCLGYNTSIIKTMNMLVEKYSDDNFNNFLYNLDGFIKFESLEGKPYIFIEQLKNENISENFYELDINTCDLYFNTIFIDRTISKYFFNKINFTINVDKFVISNDKNFENSVKEEIKNCLDIQEYLHTLLYIKIDKTCYAFNRNNNINKNIVLHRIRNFKTNEKPCFTFRGKKVEFNIEFEDIKENKIENYNVSKNFLNYVKQKIEQRIYTNCVKKSTVEKYYTHNYR